MMRQILGRLKTAAKAASGTRYDGLDLLRSDHMKAEALAIQLRLVRDKKHRKDLLARLHALLARHMDIEERILYPTCARLTNLGALIDHAHTDHQLAKDALKDLEVMNPEHGRFGELVTKLIKALEHHVYEEENKIFGGLQKHLSASELKTLSDQLLAASADRPRSRKEKRAA